MLGRTGYLVQPVALLGCCRFFQRQMGEADDGVHRSADFVAHVGKESRFCVARFLRRALGNGQCIFGATSHDNAPEVIADQLQLTHVGLVVLGRLVADTNQQAYFLPLHDRYCHVTKQCGMLVRQAVAQRFGGDERLEIIVDHRLPQANGIGPDAGIRNRVVLKRHCVAVVIRASRPEIELDRFLIVVHQVQIADFAACQPHGFVNAHLQQGLLVQRRAALAHVEHGIEARIGDLQATIGVGEIIGTFADQVFEMVAVSVQFGSNPLFLGDVFLHREVVADIAVLLTNRRNVGEGDDGLAAFSSVGELPSPAFAAFQR